VLRTGVKWAEKAVDVAGLDRPREGADKKAKPLRTEIEGDDGREI
jgi:hypothetical protein